MSARAALSRLALPCIDKEGDNGLFAKRFGRLQPMQTLYKYKARAIHPYSNRRLQALIENTRGNLVYSLLFGGLDA